MRAAVVMLVAHLRPGSMSQVRILGIWEFLTQVKARFSRHATLQLSVRTGLCRLRERKQ